ncbi:hypothetical protein ACFL58_00340 [Elusimicrobiota bacterium]
MKKRIMTLVLMLVFTTSQFVYASPLFSGSEVSVSGTLDYFSSYMWRGQTLDTDLVVQPGFTVGCKDFSFGFWSSMPVSDKDSSGASNEVDITVSYSRDFGKVGISLGYVSYEFPSTVFSGTDEVFAGFSLNELPISFGVTYYNDYDDADGLKGSYTVVDLGKDIGKITELPISVSLSMGTYSDYGTFMNGSVITVGLGSEVEISEKVTMSPSIYYVYTSGDLSEDSIGNQKGGVYGGFSLGF